VATGAVRSDAVRAVLRGRYVTTIVIDEEIATRVLQEK
jgi:DNA-binding transcriptional regulator LsrR (DeoR family)